MALPDTLAARLIQTVKTNDLNGAFVMLGRQRWLGERRGASRDLLRSALQEHLGGLPAADLANPDDIYSEQFFRKLGFATVDSMDISDGEGASLIHDLSKPVPDELRGRFDVVYDGGTCEHVFDLPAAYRNIDAMLKPGGVLIGHSPCNGWINHGFYQLTPELVYGYWERSMGYEVLELSLQPIRPAHANRTATASNPNQTGVRPRIKGNLPSDTAVILNYAVRKPAVAAQAPDGVYQTDYLARW